MAIGKCIPLNRTASVMKPIMVSGIEEFAVQRHPTLAIQTAVMTFDEIAKKSLDQWHVEAKELFSLITIWDLPFCSSAQSGQRYLFRSPCSVWRILPTVAFTFGGKVDLARLLLAGAYTHLTSAAPKIASRQALIPEPAWLPPLVKEINEPSTARMSRSRGFFFASLRPAIQQKRDEVSMRLAGFPHKPLGHMTAGCMLICIESLGEAEGLYECAQPVLLALRSIATSGKLAIKAALTAILPYRCEHFDCGCRLLGHMGSLLEYAFLLLAVKTV
ncbi:hypothetical protein GOBAR_DD27130 [Gossypium barbadense]|nr:hypothetical protein GOBAR_DD27130 [Gossypium barbadense]